jgi:hypothetical protein
MSIANQAMLAPKMMQAASEFHHLIVIIVFPD